MPEKFAKTKKFHRLVLICLFVCLDVTHAVMSFGTLEICISELIVCVYMILYASQRSHFGSGSAEAAWRSFPAVEWVMSSGNSIHTLSQGAAAPCLPGICYVMVMLCYILLY